ncbi:A-kinase anchor protein 6 [Mantella aurantiaca]
MGVVKESTTKRLPCSQAGIANTTKRLPCSQAGLTSTTKRLPRSQVGIASTTKRLPRSQVGVTSTTKRLPRPQAGITSTAKRLPPSQAGIASTTKCLPRSQVGVTCTTKRLPRSQVGVTSTTKCLPRSQAGITNTTKCLPRSQAGITSTTKRLPPSQAGIASTTKCLPRSQVGVTSTTKRLPPSLTSGDCQHHQAPASLPHKRGLPAPPSASLPHKRGLPAPPSAYLTHKWESPAPPSASLAHKRESPTPPSASLPHKRGLPAPPSACLPPSQAGIASTTKRLPPSQAGIASTTKRLPHSQVGVTSTTKRLPRSQAGITNTTKRLPPSQAGIASTTKRLPCSQVGITNTTKRLPPSQAGIASTTNHLPRSQVGVTRNTKRLPRSPAGITGTTKRLPRSPAGITKHHQEPPSLTSGTPAPPYPPVPVIIPHAISLMVTPSRGQDTDIMESHASGISEMEPPIGQDCVPRYDRPPPVHNGADWKIILHLPEIDTWIRSTSERVRGLTQSVQEDPQSKHVDVHLMQLKEICEDISDHVEQIHALLDTEFSLKLLSYSVNVIVDIHTVQLLWHQLRVSVLVLRERILQGLQDSNGNYTRQTDILQAFTKEDQEDRLDALTEVDGSGQLTIRCPPDYLSLDCGITAYELSDYSPREEDTPPPPAKPLEDWTYSAMQQEFPELVKGPGLLSVVSNEEAPLNTEMEKESAHHQKEEKGQQTLKSFLSSESTTPKRPLQEGSDHGGDSPTRPSLPKRGLFLNDMTDLVKSDSLTSVDMNLSLPVCSTSPNKHFSLSVTAAYPADIPSSSKSQVPEENDAAQNIGELASQVPQCLDGKSSPINSSHSHCSTPNESQRDQQNNELLDSPPKELGEDRWYGSDEFLALPSHLHQTDLLALRLGSLSQLVSPTPGEPQPSFRDVEDWEISSGSEVGPNSPRCFSPSTSSDIASYTNGSGRSTPHLSGSASSGRQTKAALIQRLMWDIQRQDNDRHVWDRIQGFVSKLDRFIRWLQDAMEATENWTPPQPETEALQLYLHTHLNFKQSVDSHCALKDAVLEEGQRLMEVLVSHRAGFQEMVQMITAQWKELQKQIRRQHGWILSALDTIKAEILQTDEAPEIMNEPQVNGDSASSVQAQREALTKMSLQLSSTEYSENTHHSDPVPLKSSMRCDSVQEVESECMEFWDWLLDMEATVQNSLGLLVSEEQHLQMCKRCSVEMSLREDRMHALLRHLATLRKEGSVLPVIIQDKEEMIQEKWETLKRSLSEALSYSSPRPVLSPGSGGQVQQLEQRVKELKSWLRDTELALYNSSLRMDKEDNGGNKERLQRELQQFQSLCSELRLRRRGVTSVLHLCHHLLNGQDQSPHHDPPNLQLLSVNLERRWEAIVMQSTQWQKRLQRELGDEHEMDLLVDPDWADLNNAGGEEALEWDETDITTEPVCDTEDNNQINADMLVSGGRCCSGQAVSDDTSQHSPFQTPVYQVYSLHSMERFETNIDLSPKEIKKLDSLAHLPLSLLQGCNFLSLPDLANGSPQAHHHTKMQMDSIGHSESESGIASGEGVTAANSEGCLSLDGEGPQGCQDQNEDVGHQIGSKGFGLGQVSRSKPQSPLMFQNTSQIQPQRLKTMSLERTQRIIPHLCFQRTPGQTNVNRTMLPASSADHSPDDKVDFQDLIEFLSPENSPSSSSSLESLSVPGEVLESPILKRSVSLESWPASYKSNEDLFSHQGSADITPGSDPGEELSRRTLDLLKRLEDIECPSEQKMKRSFSDDITLRCSSRKQSFSGLHLSQDKESSGNEDVGSELTELSSSEELSLRSEDMVVLKGRLGLLNSNVSFRKHLSRSLGGEEGEANLSMIVNVSCTSACTDEEDDSDLLSSSTLTLTEEDEEEEIEEPNSSMGSEDEAGDGTELPLGSDFIRRELQAWIRPSFLLPRERRKMNRVLQDMAGTSNSEKILHNSIHKQKENNGNDKDLTPIPTTSGEEKNLSNLGLLVDDVENGNVHSRIDTVKDNVIKINIPERSIKTGPYPSISITKTEKLHPPCMPALAYHKPRELGPSSNGKSNLRVTCDAVADVEMVDNSSVVPEKKQEASSSTVLELAKESLCSCHSSAHETSSSPDCTVQEFVKEILDMTSNALHRSSPQDGQSQGTGAQIREKVLEYSRRQLERGDFYSYLSLSSHDSDCGELNGSATITQVPTEGYTEQEIEDMFEACTDDKKEDSVKDQMSHDVSGPSKLSTRQSRVIAPSVKCLPYSTGNKNKVTTSGPQAASRLSSQKLQDNSAATAKGSGKISSKKLSFTKEARPEAKGKSSVKPTISSLPILHKRVRDPRPSAAGSSNLGTGQKRPLSGSKTHKDL